MPSINFTNFDQPDVFLDGDQFAVFDSTGIGPATLEFFDQQPLLYFDRGNWSFDGAGAKRQWTVFDRTWLAFDRGDWNFDTDPSLYFDMAIDFFDVPGTFLDVPVYGHNPKRLLAPRYPKRRILSCI